MSAEGTKRKKNGKSSSLTQSIRLLLVKNTSDIILLLVETWRTSALRFQWCFFSFAF